MAPRRSQQRPAAALIEEIEPRILFAADLAALALPAAPDPEHAQVRLLESAAQEESGDLAALLMRSIPSDSQPVAQIEAAVQTATQRVELVVIDSRVPDREQLLADLQEQARTQGRHFEIAVLDAQRDGLAQITELLAAHPTAAALHIVSHGSAGTLHLGATQVDSGTLAAQAGELAQWSRALDAEADILLYGCSVAAGSEGQAFIARLAALSGADVAASTDLTGDTALGGDWTLESSTGTIETSGAFSSALAADWHHVIAAPTAGTLTATTNGGLSLNLTGDDTYLEIDSGSTLLGGRTALTVEAQFSLQPGSTTHHVLLSYAVNGTNDNEVALTVLSTGQVRFIINGAELTTTSAYTQLQDGAQHQVSATWTSATGAMGIYIDGTLAQSFSGVKTGYTIAAGGTAVLGKDQDFELAGFSTAQTFSGTLYDVRLFSDVRTAGEVSANTLLNVPYNTSALLANWTFNDLSADGVVMDSVAANNLTVRHAAGFGFTTSQPALTLAVSENAANGSVVGSLSGNDLERSQRITALLNADSTLRYSAETSQFYRYVASTGSWTASEAAARNGSGTSVLGGVTGQLVTIRSATENEVVWNLAEDYSADVWIGASDRTAEGDWRWYQAGGTNDQFWSGGGSGSNVGGAYTNWSPNEPNNSGSSEHYAVLYSTAGPHIGANPTALPGAWNDEQNVQPHGTGRGYVVEWDADAVLDNGNPLTYTITAQTVTGAFAINSDTGQITVADGSLLDREAAATHSITVRTSDGSQTYDQSFTITLTNVLEAPVITSNGGGATAAVSVAENATAVTTVTSVIDVSGTAAYTIIGGADAARFSIDGSTGALSFVSAPNYESPTDANGDNVYQVTVQASDGSLTDTQALSITVTAVNDNSPVITSSGGGATASLSVAENSSAVTTITATDADLPAATLTYSIAGGADAARFSIDSTTGALSFVSAPNYENPTDANADNVYQVTVQASDGSLTDTQALSITVTAVNDNSPVITSSGGGATASLSVAENSSAVTTITATDADLPAATLTYSIAGGADAARFSIDSTTGALSFVSAPNYDTPTDADADNVYLVTVQASDGSLTDTQALSITVTAVNDNSPVITSSGGGATATLSVAENSSAVTTITATDADLPAATLTYSITGGVDAARFSINSTTGALSFVSAPNYETPTDANADNVYQVTVQVSDGSLTDTQALSITVTAVNDNSPVITSSGGGATATLSVAENSSAVTTITATDADLPAATLTYSIAGGADAARFSIDSTTGALSFVSAPNYESPTDANTDNVYQVTVQVSDGSLTDTQALSITVTAINDAAPVITSNGGGATASLSVAENSSAVTTVTATDADLPAATLTYSIAGGADAARFSIDSTTGALSFVSAPNYENPTDANADNVYQVTVQASDGSLTDTQALSITVTAVNDTAPVITSNGGGATAAVSVAENSSSVTTVTATDADLPASTLTYSIAGGADAARFSIDSATGALSFVSAPNYETPTDANADNVYQVTVQVSDGSLTDTQALSITVTAVNDAAPVITSNGGGATAALSVAENSSSVTTVTATDADLPAATLTYSIAGGADAARFSIDSATGALSFVSAPNYETPTDANADNVYQVTVQASDGSLTDTQAISITVTAVNDTAPVITSNGGGATATLSVAENSSSVTTVTATDADLPASTLTYSIAGGADAARFSIDSTTGALSFVAAPDYENPADADTDNVYRVTVQASDGSLSGTQDLSITVAAVNEHAPVITSQGGAATAALALAENGTAVMAVTATDADAPAQALNYTIVGGADAARFQLDATTGALSFISAPDFEAPADAGADNVYQVTVQASDGSLTDTQELNITVTAVNDTAPVITSNGGGTTTALSVAENGSSVTTVTATDADLPAATLTYSISGGADAARFSIDSATGALRFVNAPDHENPTDADADNVYQVTVQASDGSLTDTQALSITVTALDDNSPVITSSGGGATAALGVDENSSSVTTVTATDADLPATTLTYSIAGGADAARFQIDSATGALSFAAAPDHEAPADADADNVYHVTVGVSDGHSTATQTLTVTVGDVNDNPPVVTPGQRLTVVEISNRGTVLGTVRATDADSSAALGPWTISGGNAGGVFAIDPVTGQITVADAGRLDYETQPVFTLRISVSDGIHASTEQTVTIVLIDVSEPRPGTLPTLPVQPLPALTPPAPVTAPVPAPPAGASAAPAPSPRGTAEPLDDWVWAPEPAATRAPAAAAAGASPGTPRRASADELLSSAIDGTVSLDIDLVDMDTADGLALRTPSDDAARVARPRAAADAASRPQDAAQDIGIWAAKVSAVLVGAGLTWWSLRASGLIASLAASSPVWRHLDPIPVLGGDDGTGHSTFDTAGPPQWDDEAARDEAASRELLDEARRNLETVIS